MSISMGSDLTEAPLLLPYLDVSLHSVVIKLDQSSLTRRSDQGDSVRASLNKLLPFCTRKSFWQSCLTTTSIFPWDRWTTFRRSHSSRLCRVRESHIERSSLHVVVCVNYSLWSARHIPNSRYSGGYRPHPRGNRVNRGRYRFIGLREYKIDFVDIAGDRKLVEKTHLRFSRTFGGTPVTPPIRKPLMEGTTNACRTP